MRRKLICILMIMTLTLSITSFASTDTSSFCSDEEISVQSFPCPKCGHGLMHKHSGEEVWVRTNTWRYCPNHGGANIQWLYVKTDNTPYICDACDFGYTESYKESKWVCTKGSGNNN